MDKVGKHSPFEHVLGVTGLPVSSNPFAIIDGDTGETQEQRRLLARKSFLECEYAERRRHAERSRNRVYQTWHPGDLVYLWREGKGRENRPGKKGGWYGPARVLVQEKRHVAGGNLVKGFSGKSNKVVGRHRHHHHHTPPPPITNTNTTLTTTTITTTHNPR